MNEFTTVTGMIILTLYIISWNLGCPWPANLFQLAKTSKRPNLDAIAPVVHRVYKSTDEICTLCLIRLFLWLSQTVISNDYLITLPTDLK